MNLLAYISLLNPASLLGLLAMGVPIAIHLWSQRSGPPAWFPHLRFIQQCYQVRHRKSLPQQLILLAIRLLVFTLLIFAATRPAWVIPPAPQTQAILQKQNHLIILDESAGMWRSINGQRLAMTHRQQAIDFLESLSPQLHRAKVIILTDRLHQLNHSPTHDFQALIHQIQQYPESHHSGEHTSKLRSLLQQFTTVDLPHIQVWTDRAISSWPRSKDADQYLNPDQLRDISLQVHAPESDQAVTNLALTGIKLNPEQIIEYQESTISFYIKNFSRQSHRARLEIKGLPHPVSQMLDLKPLEQQSYSIKIKPNKTGRLYLEALISEDNLDLDNHWSLNLNVQPRKKVYLITDDQNESVLRLSNRRLMQAIGGPQQSPYQVIAITAEELLTFNAHKDSGPLFILHEAQQLQARDWNQLRQLISNGAGLLILPHAESRASIMASGLLPLKRQELAGSELVRLTSLGLDPALLKLFHGESLQAMLQQDWPLGYTGTPLSDAETLAQWNADQPAIIQRNFGKGSLILLNIALHSSLDSLYRSAVFLPFLHEALLRLQSQDQPHSSSIAFTINSEASQYEILGPDQQERFSVTDQSSKRKASLIPIRQAQSGTYRLLNEAGKLLATAHRPFPLNESSLEAYSPNDFHDMLTRELQWVDLEHRSNRLASGAENLLSQQSPIQAQSLNEYKELWPWFLFLALLLTCVELTFASLGRHKNQVSDSLALAQKETNKRRKAA